MMTQSTHGGHAALVSWMLSVDVYVYALNMCCCSLLVRYSYRAGVLCSWMLMQLGKLAALSLFLSTADLSECIG
jgi:hypothetical protein